MPIEVTIVLIKPDNKTHSRDVEVASGTSVYQSMMQAKSQGLEIPEDRGVVLDGAVVPREKEKSTLVEKPGAKIFVLDLGQTALLDI